MFHSHTLLPPNDKMSDLYKLAGLDCLDYEGKQKTSETQGINAIQCMYNVYIYIYVYVKEMFCNALYIVQSLSNRKEEASQFKNKNSPSVSVGPSNNIKTRTLSIGLSKKHTSENLKLRSSCLFFSAGNKQSKHHVFFFSGLIVEARAAKSNRELTTLDSEES